MTTVSLIRIRHGKHYGQTFEITGQQLANICLAPIVIICISYDIAFSTKIVTKTN